MPATDHQGSFLNRISIRRNQVASMEKNHDQELEDIELFQKHVADRFSDLVPPTAGSADDGGAPDTLLSIAWLHKFLDAFLCCEAEFKVILIIDRDPAHFNKPPLDRLIPELLDRSVKALDICNAITHAVDLVRHWQKLAEIVIAALEQRQIGEGQVRRAKKALNTLLTSMMFNDREIQNAAKSGERTWSFGLRGAAAAAGAPKDRYARNFRSRSLSFAKPWSAAKLIQAMSANLVAPRGDESNGLALPVYILSTVLVFSMWALVAALPCQERNGLATHFQVPKQLNWAHSIIGLQEKIGEEWKKGKKGTAGLLDETQRMEKVALSLLEFAEAFQFPAEADKAEEVAALVAEMAEICSKMEEGLGPLQQQVRRVFHRIVRSRAEILDLVDQVGKIYASPLPY